MWVAVFTGGTAVLASWVTTLGNARAARVQAETSIQAQHRDRVRSSRRDAYLDLMEQAHVTGELYWRVGDVYVQLTDQADRLERIEELRTQLRDAFDPLMRCVRVIVLEGPEIVAQAARGVLEAASETNSALRRVSQDEPQARERFVTGTLPVPPGSVHRGSPYVCQRPVNKPDVRSDTGITLRWFGKPASPTTG